MGHFFHLHWAAIKSHYPIPIHIHAGAWKPSRQKQAICQSANLPQAIVSRRRACKCCQRHVAAAIAIRCAPVHVQGPVNGSAMAMTAKPSNLKRHTPWRPPGAQPGHSLSSSTQRPAGGESTLIGGRSYAHAGKSEPRARDDREWLYIGISTSYAAGPMASRVPPATAESVPPSSLLAEYARRMRS